MNCLCQILRIKWNDKIRNSNILRNCNISGMEIFLINIQLRWAGYLIQMATTRLQKQLFMDNLRIVSVLWVAFNFCIRILMRRHGKNWQKTDKNCAGIVLSKWKLWWKNGWNTVINYVEGWNSNILTLQQKDISAICAILLLTERQV